MSTVICPECDANVEVEPGAIVGELLFCPDCVVELEITHLSPLTVELAPEIEEDWGE